MGDASHVEAWPMSMTPHGAAAKPHVLSHFRVTVGAHSRNICVTPANYKLKKLVPGWAGETESGGAEAGRGSGERARLTAI